MEEHAATGGAIRGLMYGEPIRSSERYDTIFDRSPGERVDRACEAFRAEHAALEKEKAVHMAGERYERADDRDVQNSWQGMKAGGVLGGAAMKVPERSPLDKAISEAQRAQNRLEEVVASLIDRLAPVCRPEGPVPAGADPRAGAIERTPSEATLHIRRVTDQASSTADRLLGLLDRLDV